MMKKNSWKYQMTTSLHFHFLISVGFTIRTQFHYSHLRIFQSSNRPTLWWCYWLLHSSLSHSHTSVMAVRGKISSTPISHAVIQWPTKKNARRHMVDRAVSGWNGVYLTIRTISSHRVDPNVSERSIIRAELRRMSAVLLDVPVYRLAQPLHHLLTVQLLHRRGYVPRTRKEIRIQSLFLFFMVRSECNSRPNK